MFGKVKTFSYICGEQLNDKDMNENNLLVRFDWAAKRILRDKANFGVLEGHSLYSSRKKLPSARFWKAKATGLSAEEIESI